MPYCPNDAAPAGIRIDDINKSLAQKPVLNHLNLDARQREFVAILGPSGCGKTTLLRLIAGFERLDGGTIAINHRTVSGGSIHLPPEKRNIGIVFQNFALWPHMSVAENVGYSLRVAGLSKSEQHLRISEALAKVNLEGFHQRRPADLSGGQKQRVALARCLVANPDVILLDEPLANLDVHLRSAMEQEFRKFHENAEATTLYVTHDQAEAMAMANRVAVMHDGRIAQLATPETLYSQPADEFIARFIGDGRILDVTDLEPDGGGHVRASLFGSAYRFRANSAKHKRSRARVVLRAGDLRITAEHEQGIPGTVMRNIYRGGYWQIEVCPAPAPETMLLVNSVNRPRQKAGASVVVGITDGWILPETTEAGKSYP